QLSLVVIGYSLIWILLSIRAKNEYISTVRKQLSSRRLDLDKLRVNVNESSTMRLLEETTESRNPPQAIYALSLLAERPGYAMRKRLPKVVDRTRPEIRAEASELAGEHNVSDFQENAVAELRSSPFGDD